MPKVVYNFLPKDQQLDDLVNHDKDNPDRVNCECGKRVLKGNLKRHEQSYIHIERMAEKKVADADKPKNETNERVITLTIPKDCTNLNIKLE